VDYWIYGLYLELKISPKEGTSLDTPCYKDVSPSVRGPDRLSVSLHRTLEVPRSARNTPYIVWYVLTDSVSVIGEPKLDPVGPFSS
jgi:hypothetical protein